MVTIRDIKTICTAPEGINLLVVKVETSEPGLYGLGCGTFAYRHLAVKLVVEEYLRPLLIGRDVSDINDIWQLMHQNGYWRNGPIENNAISGVDMALWDIKGKFYNAPVYDLIGGLCRDRLKVYRWIGGDRPSDIQASVTEAYTQGYRAIKMNGTEEMHWVDSFKKVEQVCERVQAIRDLYGYDMDIAVDFHGRVHKTMAKVLARELDQFRLMFIEEPVLPDNNEAMREIRLHTATPIACGERMFSRFEYKHLFEQGYVDIVQPDLSHAGGISECLTIARMAEAYDVAIAPHCPLGPIALGACMNLDCVSPNAFIQEQSLGIHYNKGGDLLDYLNDPSIYKYKDGFIEIVSHPGLGVDINEEFVAEKAREFAANRGDWKNPVWHNYDGTVAEW